MALIPVERIPHLLPRIDIVPEEGAGAAAEGEAGADGVVAGAAGGNSEGTAGGGNGESDSGEAGDGRWGAGGTGGGDDSASGNKVDTEMTDHDEISNPPGSLSADAAAYDNTKAWKHQQPLPQFQTFYTDAKNSFSGMLKPDKALFWSAGDMDIVTADGKTYVDKAAELK